MNDETTLTRLCRVEDVPLNEARRFVVGETPIAVFHLPVGFFALGNTCSHEEASLAEGFIEDDVVECPRHGAQFDLETGQNRSLPATKPVPSYRVVEENGDVYVEVPNG